MLQFHHHRLSAGRGTRIDVRDLEISSCLVGSGAFADVYKAKLVSRRSRTQVEQDACIGENTRHTADDVAVKIARGGLRRSQRCACSNACFPFYPVFFRHTLLREAELMYQIGGNPHILRLIGHALLNDHPILVLEYCANGDLLTFLRKTLRTQNDDVATVGF